ncbi:MAG: hypothetical protein JW918_06320 [Anaerolineae bacterium]|nr:hypothetical protein [Anaerolineae bacterium]
MKVLFIGGTGANSSACPQPVVERGTDLTLFNRGETGSRSTPRASPGRTWCTCPQS